MSIYSSILTGFMKNELGFDGFLLSDYGEASKLEDNLPTSWVKVSYTKGTCLMINAGIDMMMVPHGIEGY